MFSSKIAHLRTETTRSYMISVLKRDASTFISLRQTMNSNSERRGEYSSESTTPD